MRTSKLAIVLPLALAASGFGAAGSFAQAPDAATDAPAVQAAPHANAEPAKPPEAQLPVPQTPAAPMKSTEEKRAQEMQPRETQAQEKPPQALSSRFSFNRVDGGFVRLDTMTGQVALCSQHTVGWACEAVPEERAAFEKEIARLQGEVKQLKDQTASLKADILALREPPPPRPPAELAPRPDKNLNDKQGDVTIKLPTREDVARARAAVEDAWRRLVDMIVDFKNDVLRKG